MRGLIVVLGLLLVVPVALSASDYPALDQLANAQVGPVQFKMPEAPLWSVFDTIAKFGGFKVVSESDWPKEKVSVVWEAPTIREALIRLAKEFNLDYATPSPHKLVVMFKGK